MNSVNEHDAHMQTILEATKLIHSDPDRSSKWYGW